MEREIKKYEKESIAIEAEDSKRINPYVKQHEQKLGQLSLTDGVPIIHSAPAEKEEDIGVLGSPDLAA